jgi:hypothetical protein
LRKAREVSVTGRACSTSAGDDLRVAVALVDRRVGGEEVHVLAALDVPHPDALGAGDDDVERVVVVGAVALLEGDELGWSSLAVGLDGLLALFGLGDTRTITAGEEAGPYLEPDGTTVAIVGGDDPEGSDSTGGTDGSEAGSMIDPNG